MCLSLREQMALGAVAGAFPDLDFAGFLVDPLTFLAYWHQGPTHSLVLLPLWSVLIGGTFVLARAKRHAFVPASAIAALGLVSHIASDAVTAYGTAVFWPLSELRIGLGMVYVIDPLFTLILLAGLGMAAATGRRFAAVSALVALGVYVTSLAWLQQRAVELARASPQTQGRGIEQLTALAQPFSPFNWKLIGSSGPVFHETYLNLVGHPPLPALPERAAAIAGAYRGPEAIAWRVRDRAGGQSGMDGLVAQRWSDPRFATYRHFARYPAVSRIERNGETCVWFTDLRYDLPALPDTFRYGFCRETGTEIWQLYRLRYFSNDARQRLPE